VASEYAYGMHSLSTGTDNGTNMLTNMLTNSTTVLERMKANWPKLYTNILRCASCYWYGLGNETCARSVKRQQK